MAAAAAVAAPYPPISVEGFKRGVNDGIEIISKFFNEFQPVFGGAPDERGLTDQLLLAIAKKAGKIILSRTAPQQEGQWGYDYLLKFAMKKNTDKPYLETENVAIYIQAKSYKPETFGGAAIDVADFTYTPKGSTTSQMDLLHATIEAAKDPTARIFGGYILYSGTINNNMFIPIEDIRTAFRQIPPTNKDAVNRAMSNALLTQEISI